MGNTASTPDLLYKAVQRQDVREVEALCRRIQQQGAQAPEVVRRHMEYVGPDGRTPLILAAKENHEHIARLLLQHGANINAIVLDQSSAGTALHEAVIHLNETLVDLLLLKHANPFLENFHRQTPLDLALHVGDLRIFRKLEQLAIFSGYVSMKVPQYKHVSTAVNTLGRYAERLLGDRSEAIKWVKDNSMVKMGKESLEAWKDRWCVVAPRFSLVQRTPPQRGQAPFSQLHVMRELLILRDQQSTDVRTRIDLSQASATLVGPLERAEAVLHLPPSHPEPQNCVVERDGGGAWQLYFRPAQHAPNAHQEFHRLLASCNEATAAARPPPQGPPEGVMYPPAGPQYTGSPLSPQQGAPLPPQPSVPMLPPSAPPQPPEYPAGPPPGPGVATASGGDMGPSAPSLYPPIPGSGPSSPGAVGQGVEDKDLCIICLDRGRQVGFLHGDSVHYCVCRDCAVALPDRRTCPLCRQPVERIIGVY